MAFVLDRKTDGIKVSTNYSGSRDRDSNTSQYYIWPQVVFISDRITTVPKKPYLFKWECLQINIVTIHRSTGRYSLRTHSTFIPFRFIYTGDIIYYISLYVTASN